jgi:hypothetical protein
VRFIPGARTNWHSHALGQTLYITDGIGLVGTRNGDIVRVRAGQTVTCPPGEEHGHGGTETTLVYTAEIYGPYTNEELVGRAIKDRCDQVVLATKFGMVSHAGDGPGHLDSSPSNVRTAIEGSIRR